MNKRWKVSIVMISVIMLCVMGICTACSGGNAGGASGGNSDVIYFETTDLDGNVVRSEDLFKGHRLTMVNIWGTFCGPCIDEMPELEKLNYRLKQKDCAIIGIVSDVQSPEDSETIGAAKGLIEEIGVKYTNLVPWDDTWEVFPAQFIPTSYLVDEEGRIVGEAVVGARSVDDYDEWIDGMLK